MTALIALLIRLLPPTLRLREALRRMLGAALRVLIDVDAGCLNVLSQDQLTQMDGALRGYEAAMARLICGHGYYRAGRALPDLPPSAFDWAGDPCATHAGVLARVGRLLQLIDGLDRYADRHMARLACRTGNPLRLGASRQSTSPLRVGGRFRIHLSSTGKAGGGGLRALVRKTKGACSPARRRSPNSPPSQSRSRPAGPACEVAGA
jgi:hypothetical protein